MSELKEKVFQILLDAYKAGRLTDSEMIEIIETYKLLKKDYDY